MGQGSLGEVESIVSPVAEAVARELEPVQRGLTQAGAQVSASLNLLLCTVSFPSRCPKQVPVFRGWCQNPQGKPKASSSGTQTQLCPVLRRSN